MLLGFKANDSHRAQRALSPRGLRRVPTRPVPRAMLFRSWRLSQHLAPQALSMSVRSGPPVLLGPVPVFSAGDRGPLALARPPAPPPPPGRGSVGYFTCPFSPDTRILSSLAVSSLVRWTQLARGRRPERYWRKCQWARPAYAFPRKAVGRSVTWPHPRSIALTPPSPPPPGPHSHSCATVCRRVLGGRQERAGAR